MIWDGTSPLHPEHEVAYRGWPKKRVAIDCFRYAGMEWPIAAMKNGVESLHLADGRYYREDGPHRFDLIPLQQEPAK